MHEQKKRLKLLLKICQRLGRSTGDRQLRILSSEQLGYVSHRLSVPCHVEACPGSGKTEIVGIKAAYEFLGWQDRFSGIAILTFTKNAAAEIKSRVVHYAGARSTIHPHFVGTIDSWLHSYLFQPFSHAVTGYLGALDGDRSTRIIESDTVPAFLNNYIVTANGGGAVFANQYHQRLDGRLEGETSLARFDQQQLERTKRRFLKDGFATYQDAETLCYRVLRECQIIAKLLARRFTHIIVDECQDLSDTQLYVFYELLKAGAVFHFVGDLNQAIYEFRSVNPSNVASFVKKQGFVRRSLTQNHRSNQPIVDVCSRLIGIGGIQASRPVASETPCILWQYTDHTFGSLPRFFHKVITSAGLSDQNSCIVARGRSLIKQLSPQTEAHIGPVQLFEVALSCWKLANRSAHHMQRALDYAGKSLSVLAYGGRGHHSKQYCPEKVDSKKWRIFLADVLN
ncbi:MAG TPA: ATP-dependent helicase, partial [Pyrinomonadaceae bacterium]|nr:ATP-dependent helicase [Pyrinomonadaceae bacterium]